MDPQSSKRILLASLFIMIIIIGISLFPSTLLVKKSTRPSSPETVLASQILTISALPDPNADPDKDGIPNWQEKILGTNPEEKDTVDTSAFQVSSEEKKRVEDPNNMTVALAKNNLAVASYASSIASSSDIDYDGLSSDVLRSTAASFSFKVYTEKEITPKVKATQTSRKTYGNLLGQKTAMAIKSYGAMDDRAALKDLMNDETSTQNIKDLDAKIKGVGTLRDSLLSMDVPDDALAYHIGYINAIERYYETLVSFRKVHDDPLKAGLLLRGYKEIIQSQFKFLADFEGYFSKNYLVFSPKDMGYMFTVGIYR